MLECEELTLRRHKKVLFNEASFALPIGSTCAVTGHNGSGKSSLFAMILGELDPDHGHFHLPGQPVIAHVAQETPALSQSALDYVLEGDAELVRLQKQLEQAETKQDHSEVALLHSALQDIDAWSAPARAATLLYGLGFNSDQHILPVNTFSGGWRMRLNLAQALMCRSDLLLLDEPTNHLDLDTLVWLENWIKQYSGTVLLISHDRDFLDQLCNHVIHLENQTLQLYSGNYSECERTRLAQQEQKEKAFLKQQKDIAHLNQFIDRFRAKATKAKQAQSRIKALEKIQPILLSQGEKAFQLSFLPPEHLPAPLLVLRDADIGYPDKTVFEKLNLTLMPGEQIGILGRNGAGKSTLIQALTGELALIKGDRVPAKQLKIAYFAQHQLDRLATQSTPDAHIQAIAPEWTEQQRWDFLGRFGFDKAACQESIESFSGGERARLALAMLIQQKPNLILLDEPTNHLDMMTRESLALALQNFEGSMILVSHDRHLLKLSCNQFYKVENGRLDEWHASLETYSQQLMDQNYNPASGDNDKSDASTANKKSIRQEKALLRAQLKPLRQQVSQTEKKQNALSQQFSRIESDLAKAELYQAENKVELQQLIQEQALIKKQLNEAEESWLDAVEQLETAQSELET